VSTPSQSRDRWTATHIDQDRLERIQKWFETKKEAKDDSAVGKFTDGCNKRDWAESIRTHLQHKLNPKLLL
jgi:hypothetical protein